MGCCVHAYICVSLPWVPFLVIVGALLEVSVENDAYLENLAWGLGGRIKCRTSSCALGFS